MKRWLIACALLASFGGAAAAASVTVTKPAAGDSWTKGQPHPITWTKTGDMPATVRIVLRNQQNTAAVQTIADSAPNSGSYSWTIPASVADGQYRIRVKVLNADILDDGDVFTINSTAGASIAVTKPVAGETWLRGKPAEIRWTKTGTMAGTVQVLVIGPNSSHVQSTLTTANLGSCFFSVSDGYPYGQYRLRVQVPDGSVYGDSGIFTIGTSKDALAKGGTPMSESAVKDYFRTVWNYNHSGWGANDYYLSHPPSPVRETGYTDWRTAHVGYDRFAASPEGKVWWFTGWDRSRIFFNSEEFKGWGSRLVWAKLHFKQLTHLASGDTRVSCGTGIFQLLAPWDGYPMNPPVRPVGGLGFGSAEYDVDVTEAVRKWLDGALPDYGFMIKSEEPDWGQQERKCYSSYEITITLRFRNG